MKATIFTETVEESSSTRSSYDIELSKLQAYIQTLNKEIAELKRERSQSQSPHHTTQVSNIFSIVLTFTLKMQHLFSLF